MFVSRRLPPLLHFCSSKYRAELCAPRIWRRKLWIHSAHIWKHTSQVLLWKVWGGRDLQAPPTQSLWCKVPEESPAVVSGDIMQLSWGQCEWARGERFLSPEVATFNDFPAQGDKMFPLLRFDLHTFSLICVDQKKKKKKRAAVASGIGRPLSRTICWEGNSHGEFSLIPGSICPPTLLHSYGTELPITYKGSQ